MELFYLISLGKLHSRILNFSRLKFSPSLAAFKFCFVAVFRNRSCRLSGWSAHAELPTDKLSIFALLLP